MLVGAGALSLAFGTGSATAAVKYHHRHLTAQSVQAPVRADTNVSFGDTHNPAKKYPTRQISENAVKNGTLIQNGNNPAKRYPTRQLSENAARSGTLMQNGNNPAKRYPVTASR
jgi:hypothetical protein